MHNRLCRLGHACAGHKAQPLFTPFIAYPDYVCKVMRRSVILWILKGSGLLFVILSDKFPKYLSDKLSDKFVRQKRKSNKSCSTNNKFVILSDKSVFVRHFVRQIILAYFHLSDNKCFVRTKFVFVRQFCPTNCPTK